MPSKAVAKARRTTANRRVSRRTPEDYLVLRTVYMSPNLDNKLRLIAEKKRRSKNEIIREILSDAVGV